MAYDFHYQPTGSGAISGQQVLQQTEDAINELGDYVNDNVGGAMDVAQQAFTNSANAVDDAQTALNTANNAEGVAIQAQTDVGNLSGTVTNIGNRVTTAEGNITNLQGRMTTAEGNITNLQGRMTTAETNIGNLQTAVSTAQATANSAQQTATTARQQAYVFRYSSTALVASSTNSNTLLDNTDNLKVGDKVIDSNGVLFSITAIDTANSTFSIGTALIDLALDGDVVHTSGDETINGVKSFINYFLGKDLSGQTVDLNDCVDAYGGAIHYYYAVSNYTNISNKPENKPFILESRTVRYVSSVDYTYYQKIYTADYNTSPSIYTRYYSSGSASWSNWVKDTDKFVTTDTNQTVGGVKTFNSNTLIYNSDNTATTPNLYLRSSKIELSSQGNTSGEQNLTYLDKNSTAYAYIKGAIQSNGSAVKIRVVAKNSSNNLVINELQMLAYTNGNKAILPSYSNEVDLGLSSYKWKSFNGVEPSSLSLPSGNASDIIDISSYITALDGTTNSYTVPANGWISIAVVGTAIAIVSSSWSDSRLRESSGNVRILYPVLKNETVSISVIGTTLTYARFIPCQGNV